jgi:membrane-associated phospholipid phosphatase
MRKKPIVCLLTWMTVSSCAFGQVQPSDSVRRAAPGDSMSYRSTSLDSLPAPENDPTVVKPNWAYVKSYYTDTKAVLKAPLHWKGKDFIKLAAITGVSVGLYAVDQRIRDWSQAHKTDFTTGLSEVVDPLGNGRYLWITSGAVFLGGQLFKNDKATRVGLLILESQLINGVLGQIVKIATSRIRPRDGGHYNDWEGPNITPNYSFPSGHAQTAFALMTVVAMEYRHIKIIPPIAYGLAALTSLSRINQDAHWSSDIFVGSALGFFISRVIVQQHTKPDSRLGLAPLMGKGRSGLSLTYRF